MRALVALVALLVCGTLALNSAGCGKALTYGVGATTPGSILWAGVTRNYYIYIPPGYTNNFVASMVVLLHGGGSNATTLQANINFDPNIADVNKVVTVYPEGIGNGWNAGLCCGTARKTNVDDVGFIGALIDQLASQVCIDVNRYGLRSRSSFMKLVAYWR